MLRITKIQEIHACKLYKQNLSALQVAKKLKLSLNQVYDALKKHSVPRRNASEQNKLRFLAKPLSYNISKRLSGKEKQLMASAIMLYCGEGAKTGNTVDFANSSPGIIQVFVYFLRRVCQIDENRLRLYLYCFANQNSNKLISFWSKLLKVDKANFTKPYVREARVGHSRTIKYGVLHVRYSDKKLLQEILLLSEKFIQELTG